MAVRSALGLRYGGGRGSLTSVSDVLWVLSWSSRNFRIFGVSQHNHAMARAAADIRRLPPLLHGRIEMITLEPPHMGINDRRTHMRVNMLYNMDVQRGHTPNQVISYVATIATRLPDKKLKNVVFSCHGSPGYLEVGRGFTYKEIGLFLRWEGIVEKIWFHGCRIAGGELGNYFCSGIAKAASCYVVAPTEYQVDIPRVFPYGQLGTFEGLLLSFSPDGSVSWSHRYPSTDPRKWTYNPD